MEVLQSIIKLLFILMTKYHNFNHIITVKLLKVPSKEWNLLFLNSNFYFFCYFIILLIIQNQIILFHLKLKLKYLQLLYQNE